MRNTTTEKRGALTRRAGPLRAGLTTALMLASVLAMSVAIAPQAHAQATNPNAPPAAAQVDPSTPDALGPDTKPDEPNFVSSCPPDRMCLFEHWHYEGRMRASVNGSSNLDLPPSFNDITSSVQNNTPYRWCVYEHWHYEGRWAYVPAHGSYPTVYPWWNDVISSWRRC
jgi:hypothetical protein